MCLVKLLYIYTTQQVERHKDRALQPGKEHKDRFVHGKGIYTIMRRSYEVCRSCRQSWIWQGRLLSKPDLKCLHCGTAWQTHTLPDLKKKRRVAWAAWNFPQRGERWPHKSYKDILLDKPPGLHGGQPKKPKKVKQTALTKAVQEHWEQLPEAMKKQCEATNT